MYPNFYTIKNFVDDFSNFVDDLYTNNNISELTQKLLSINQQYDALMNDEKITNY